MSNDWRTPRRPRRTALRREAPRTPPRRRPDATASETARPGCAPSRRNTASPRRERSGRYPAPRPTGYPVATIALRWLRRLRSWLTRRAAAARIADARADGYRWEGTPCRGLPEPQSRMRDRGRGSSLRAGSEIWFSRGAANYTLRSRRRSRGADAATHACRNTPGGTNRFSARATLEIEPGHVCDRARSCRREEN